MQPRRCTSRSWTKLLVCLANELAQKQLLTWRCHLCSYVTYYLPLVASQHLPPIAPASALRRCLCSYMEPALEDWLFSSFADDIFEQRKFCDFSDVDVLELSGNSLSKEAHLRHKPFGVQL